MKRIIILSILTVILHGIAMYTLASEGSDGELENGIEVRLIPVTTAVENGMVRMAAKLKLINKMDVDIRDIQVSASANEQVQVDPEKITMDYLAARSEVFAEELVTVVSPEPDEQEDTVDHGLVWKVKYHIIESEVTKKDAPEIAKTGAAKLTKQEVVAETGIKWTKIKAKGEIIEQAAREHPLNNKEAVLERQETGKLKKINKKQAQNIALEFLCANGEIFGFVESLEQREKKVEETQAQKEKKTKSQLKVIVIETPEDPNVPYQVLTDTNEYKVLEVFEHKYTKEESHKGCDYGIVVQQKKNGIPVFQTQCRILMDQFGEIYKVKNSVRSNIIAPLNPALSSEDSVLIAMKAVNSPNPPRNAPQLVIYGTEHLGWHMNFDEPAFREIIIDAISGEVLLNRANIVEECIVGINVRDADNENLQYVAGSYIVPISGTDVTDWTLETDENGNCESLSIAGNNAYCRATLDCDRIVVRDGDNGGDIVFRDTPRFNTVDDTSYGQIIYLSGTAIYDLSEASVCFREINRAWDYLNANYSLSQPKITANIDATDTTGAHSHGNAICFANGLSVLINGLPSNLAPIEDTILHEYGHCIQWSAYGNQWGIPNDFTWVNHGWLMQTGGDECSFDAVIEGWAEYFPVVVYNQINPNDTGFGASDGSYNVNLEDNTGYAGNGWNPSMEERNEFGFAQVLWDIYDDTPTESHDGLALGENEIWNIMRLDNPSTVEQFFQNFIERYPGYVTDLEEIYIAHGMHPDCMKLTTDFDDGDTHTLTFERSQTEKTFKIRVEDWYGGDPTITTGPFADGLEWEIDTDELPTGVTLSVSSGDLKWADEDEITVMINHDEYTGSNFTLKVVPNYGRTQEIEVEVEVSPPLDLIFCIDTTGSMWDDIAAVKVAAVEIINQIATEIPDFRIAVVDYRDFPVYPYGGSGDYEYHDVLGFTNNEGAAVSAIQSLSLGWGADWQESVYSALMHCIESTSLGGWRGQPIKKVIILMGDAPPHDPEPFTGYTMADVVQAAEDADPVIAYPIAIGGDSTTMAYFSGLADGTGGEVFTAANASEIVEAIMEAIEVITYSPFAEAGGPYEGEVGQPIVFDGSSSYDPDGEIVLYEWDWDSNGIYDDSSTNPIIEHTWYVEFSGTVRMRITDNDGLSNIDTAEVTVLENTPPEVEIIVPDVNDALQDGVTLTAEANDISGVDAVYFYIREPNDGNGIPIGYEGLTATYNSTSDTWEYPFDTLVLPDGYYVILASAIDPYSNEGWSDVVPFSIRNWAVVELLPASQEYRAGRTMPIKFSLRIAEAVDPAMPFVYNEELEIRIYKDENPVGPSTSDILLQTSLYGDTSTDYRINTDAELYITNFKTDKRPAEYRVEIWRQSRDFLVDSFTFETSRK